MPMIFSDRTIREAVADGKILLDPFDPTMVQPSSVDVRCASEFRVFENHRYPLIDPKAPQEDLTKAVEAGAEEPFILHPGEFVLGATLEVIGLADDIVNSLSLLICCSYAEIAPRRRCPAAGVADQKDRERDHAVV